MKLEQGRSVFLTESPEEFQITHYDPDLEEQLRLGREFMTDYRDTFHALAK